MMGRLTAVSSPSPLPTPDPRAPLRPSTDRGGSQVKAGCSAASMSNTDSCASNSTETPVAKQPTSSSSGEKSWTGAVAGAYGSKVQVMLASA